MAGSIVARGPGTWAVVIELPRGEDGKRRQKWHTVKGTKKAAERELARLLHERNTGSYIEPSEETVATHLRRWLGLVAAQVGAVTLDRYRSDCERHLIPRFGRVRLDRLNAAMIADFYVWALEQGAVRGGPLSSQSVFHLGRTLRQALDMAVELGLLLANPAKRVKLPRPENRQTQALTDERLRQVLAAVSGTPLYSLTLLAIVTGARRGEMLALGWSDIDLDARTVTIRHSLQQSDDGVRVKAPKSAAGRRMLTLPPVAVMALRRVKAEQAERRLRLGEQYLGDSVFAYEDGRPWVPDQVTMRFARAMRRAAVEGVTLHTLRHNYGSHLLAGGIAVNAVAEVMGHSTATITLNRYAHLVGGEREQAAVVMEGIMRRVMGGG